MALRRFVKGGADDFGLFHGTFHIRDFFGAFVDEQDDQIDVGIVGIDGVGQRLQQNSLAGTRRGHDETALTTADGRHDVDDAVGKIFLAVFHDQLVIRIDGRQVVEQNEIFGIFRRFEADLRHFEQGKVAFAFFWGADLAGNDIAFTQGKAADLGGRNIDVVRAGHVAAQRRAQEAEAVGQDLQDAIPVDGTVLGGTGLQEGEDEFLLAHGAGIFDLVLLSQFHQGLHAAGFQFCQAQAAI